MRQCICHILAITHRNALDVKLAERGADHRRLVTSEIGCRSNQGIVEAWKLNLKCLMAASDPGVLHLKRVPILVCLACLLLFNGCATSYLWRGSDLAGYNDPMPKNRLALFDAAEKRDVLVQY